MLCATAFSHKLFLPLLLLPPCMGDSKAPKPSQPFASQRRSTHQSIFQQSAQSKQICPRCLFVLPLVPSLLLSKAFQAVPVSCGTRQTLKLWVCHLSLAALLPDIMFPTTLLHSRALLLSIAPTLSCRSRQVSGFAPGKLSRNASKKLQRPKGMQGCW